MWKYKIIAPNLEYLSIQKFETADEAWAAGCKMVMDVWPTRACEVYLYKI